METRQRSIPPKSMDEEHSVETPAAPKDTIPEVASCGPSTPTAAITNGTTENTQNTDALTAVSSHAPDDTPHVGTPEHVHVLALHREETPHHVPPSSPTTIDSTNTPSSTPTTHAASSSIQSEKEEVERLRREAARIKQEQARLEEEIRIAKLQREELERYALTHAHIAKATAEEEEDIEIYCENPIEVMSAITEEPRTLVLEREDVEVMSQITEARTEAKLSRNGKRRMRWMVVLAFGLTLVGIAAIVGGVRSRKGNAESASAASSVGDSTRPTLTPTGEDGFSPTRYVTSFPTSYGASSPTASATPVGVDATDHDDVISPATDDDAEIVFPTPSPSISLHSSSTSPTLYSTYARTVKIQTNNETVLNVFEVQVIHPSGINVAYNKNATQSSTWDEYIASYAVDGFEDTFSSTLLEDRAWWQVDLEQMTPIDNVTILNYYCIDESDPAGCSARLSHSTLSLIDDEGVVVATEEIGDTEGLLELTFHFYATKSHSGAPSVSVGNPPSVRPSTSSIRTPTLTPTLMPIQEPTVAPTEAPIIQSSSLAPSQSGRSCPSDQGLLGIFFIFGADPSQISWYVADDCTGDIVANCQLGYENADPYATSAHHRCLPLSGYAFYFSDAAGDIWPTDSGFSVVFDGNSTSVEGSGTSLENTSLPLGGGASSCPTVAPTTKTSASSTTIDQLPFPYPYPSIRFTPWDMLGDPYIIYADSLGYNSYFWDNPNTYYLEYNNVFATLNSTQQQAITDLGLSEEQWDCFMNHYESYRWDYLPDYAVQALIDLGWSQCAWDMEQDCSNSTPTTEGVNWRRLTSEEKAAAINLCWSKWSWDLYALPW